MDFFRGVGRRLEIGIGDFGGFLNRKREKKQTKRKKGWECLHAFGNSWKNYGEVFFLSYIYITFRVLVCGCEICAFKSETVRKDNDIHHFLPPNILNQKNHETFWFRLDFGVWIIFMFPLSPSFFRHYMTPKRHAKKPPSNLPYLSAPNNVWERKPQKGLEHKSIREHHWGCLKPGK